MLWRKIKEEGGFLLTYFGLGSNVTSFYFEIGNLGGLEKRDTICLKRRTTFRNRTVGTLSKKLIRQLSDLHFVGNQATQQITLYTEYREQGHSLFPLKL